jgi:hypothetical protein
VQAFAGHLCSRSQKTDRRKWPESAICYFIGEAADLVKKAVA